MAKIILFNMISIDGYFEGPGRDISWHNVNEEFNEFAVEQLNSASALIFGRRTYELMVSYWPSEEALRDDPVVAGLMNSKPKIVFSKTMKRADWTNTRVYNGNVEKVCLGLKAENVNDIYVFVSAELASDLISMNLIDEFRFVINPVVLGSGVPIFRSSSGKRKMKLVRSAVFASGNVLVIYTPE
jgi:dihydrofolate reductase